MKSLKVLLVSFVLLSSILTVSSFAQEAVERSEFKQGESNKGVARQVNPGEMRFDKKGVWIDDVSLAPEIASTNNYAFVTTTTGSLTDMSTGTTTLVGANLDDTASALTNIGFDFWFQGVRFTQFSANSNGVVRLGGAVAGGSPYQALAQAGLSILSPFSSDQRTHTTGLVRFKVIGAAPNRTLVIEWLNMQSNFNSGGTADLTYQMRLSETTGVIEYAYGVMTLSAAAAADANSNDPQIGFSSTNTAGNVGSVTAAQSGAPPPTYNGTSAVPTNNLYVAGSIVALSGATDGSRRTFTFTSPVPVDPSGLNFTAVTAVGMTLNWTDNSSNEAGFVIYRSTDNVNFSFFQQAPENATSAAVTGLTPSTTYFWRVASVSEGALSAGFTSGTQATGAPGADSCLGAGGNWSAAGTWTDGTPPTSGDIVTIGAGCTVTIDSSNAFSVIVQSGGVLQFEQVTARTLTVVSDVTIDAGGTFQSNPAGTVTTHVLSIGGNLTNNGTLDFSTNANTAGAGITFTGAANNTFGGTGATTDVRTIVINKGTSNANILELTTSAFSVRGAVVDSTTANYLTLTNGTFKISGTFTANFRTIPATGSYTINATSGIWLNNPNYTVTGVGGTLTLAGLLRVSQGTYNVGTAAGNSIAGSGTLGVTNIDGATAVVNVAGRFEINSTTYNQSAGNVNVCTVGNTSGSFACFDGLAAGTANMSGGNINLVRAATAFDYWVDSTVNYTNPGTTVNVGTAATLTPFIFRLRGTLPNLNVDSTTNAKTAQFVAQTLIRGDQTIQAGATYNLNGFLVAVIGPESTSIVNNGTIVGSTAGSTWYFQNTSPMVVSGSGIQGTNVAPIASLSIDSTGGVDFATLANNAILRRINLFTGSTTGSSKLTLGAGDATVNIIQIGNNAAATAAGSFDVPLTFNLGTGGQTIFYLRETGTRTTGNEVNPARTLVGLTYDDNGVSKTLTIAGGNLLVTGAMALNNGVILTGANILTHNGAATRIAGHVDGILNRTYTATGAYTYHVGQNGYSPVGATITTLTTNPSDLSVQPFDATLGGFSPAQSISRNWLLTENGDLTADITLTYLVADENGNEADYRVWRRDGAGVATDLCGAPCVNTGTNVAGPAVGVTAFGRFTAAEALTPTAAAVDISGRILTAGGMPIANVRVILSGGQLSEPINVYTGHLGIYSFQDVPVGQNYVITVKSRRFFFAKPSHLFTLNDDLIDQDFVAEPQWP